MEAIFLVLTSTIIGDLENQCPIQEDVSLVHSLGIWINLASLCHFTVFQFLVITVPVPPNTFSMSLLYCIVLYCIEGVVIAAQCTPTFSDFLRSPEFGY